MATTCLTPEEVTALAMTNCVQTLSPEACADPPEYMFLFVLATGIAIALVFTFIAHYWQEHKDRAIDAIKHPWQLKSGIFILYSLFVVGYSVHWTLGNYLNSIGVVEASGYFSNWVIPNLVALSCFVSTIWLLTARLGEIARSTLAELSNRNSISGIEKFLIFISICSPVIATISCLANMGTNYGIWAAYTYQLEAQTGISILLIVVAEYAVRAHDLSRNTLFAQALNRVRVMTAVLILHTVFNIVQNTFHLVMFPMFVWRIWEIGELLTIQRCIAPRDSYAAWKTKDPFADKGTASDKILVKPAHRVSADGTADHITK
ncbi:hypothetical protein PBRA_001266 [Plasmodiophora brassicae]|nr:hypothetical protein PBRA_001266 [Plasmodiophora brassicae]